jgi:hypothetical protein
MKRPLIFMMTGALVLAVLACQDSGAPGSTTTTTESDAFTTLPLGFADVQSTFGGEDDDGTTEWAPRGQRGNVPHGDGKGLMFGGLAKFFNFNSLLRPFPTEASDHCTFNASSGRLECDPVTRGGLTITRSAAFTDADGNVQQAFDGSTTNTINVQVEVSGTKERHDGNSSTIHHHSDHTVTGLAEGSTELTLNGESAGVETTTGTDDVGDFTAERKIGDTVEDLVVPVHRGRRFPTSGTIVRTVEVTITYTGQAPKTFSRREVVTFTGSNSATVEITQDGSTRTCSLVLPHGSLSCS